MVVVLNGKEVQVDCPISIKKFLSLKWLKEDRVIVEVNFQIVKKQEWEEFLISDGDQVEVLQFVGGG